MRTAYLNIAINTETMTVVGAGLHSSPGDHQKPMRGIKWATAGEGHGEDFRAAQNNLLEQVNIFPSYEWIRQMVNAEVKRRRGWIGAHAEGKSATATRCSSTRHE